VLNRELGGKAVVIFPEYFEDASIPGLAIETDPMICLISDPGCDAFLGGFLIGRRRRAWC
jgi:hypothetical protein